MHVKMAAHKGPRVLREAHFTLPDHRFAQLLNEWLALGHRVVIKRHDLGVRDFDLVKS